MNAWGCWSAVCKTCKCFVYAYLTSLVVSHHVGGLVYCQGVSMEPTIRDGDVVLAERLSVKRNKFSRGSIVCVKSPVDSNVTLCKRLTHLERDVVDHQAFSLHSAWPRRIPAGFCLLEGDNTCCSTDSRQFGPIPLGLVSDRVVGIVWPPSRISWL